MLKALSGIVLAIALPAAAVAQTMQAPATKPAQPQAMTCMDHSKMGGMDHSKMAGMDHSKMSGMDMSAMDHSKMAGMDMPAMDHSKMMGSCMMPPKAGSASDHQGHSH